MSTEGYVKIPVHADCGHQFEVSLVGHDPHTMEIICPVCGATDRFTPEQAASIVEQYEAAKRAAPGIAQRALDDAFKKAFKGSKSIQYRSKR